MKFAILSGLPLDDPRGGAEVVASLMRDGLRAAGHEVHVVTHAPMDLFIGAKRPDVVITHNVRALGWLLPRRIKKLGLRHVHVLHDVQLIEPSGIAYDDLRQTFTRRVWTSLMRWIWQSPEVVIGPSQWILDAHAQWGFFKNSKKIHLRNPVGVTLPTPPFSREGGASTLPLEEKGACLSAGRLEGVTHRRFVFVGQIEPHKGVFDLVEAARGLPPDVRVEFVGVGSALRELQRRTEGDSRFVFRGRVRPEDVTNMLAGATATVVPSRCLENAPMTITQSLAVGVPVIATSVGGIPELVHDSQNGLLVPPGDIPALARALQSALDAPLRPQPAVGMDVDDYCARLILMVSNSPRPSLFKGGSSLGTPS